MKRMVVIGIGNTLMQDDGIGTRIAEAIQEDLMQYDVYTVSAETDFQYCFGTIRPDDFLVVLDAMYMGYEPGSLEVIPIRQAMQEFCKPYAQHEASLLDLLKLHMPEIEGFLIGIEAGEIDLGFDLSDALNRCFDRICDDVLRTVLQMKEELENA